MIERERRKKFTLYSKNLTTHIHIEHRRRYRQTLSAAHSTRHASGWSTFRSRAIGRVCLYSHRVTMIWGNPLRCMFDERCVHIVVVLVLEFHSSHLTSLLFSLVDSLFVFASRWQFAKLTHVEIEKGGQADKVHWCVRLTVFFGSSPAVSLALDWFIRPL